MPARTGTMERHYETRHPGAVRDVDDFKRLRLAYERVRKELASQIMVQARQPGFAGWSLILRQVRGCLLAWRTWSRKSSVARWIQHDIDAGAATRGPGRSVTPPSVNSPQNMLAPILISRASTVVLNR